MMSVARIIPPRLARALEILHRQTKAIRGTIQSLRQDIEEMEVLREEATRAWAPLAAVRVLTEQLTDLREQLAAGMREFEHYDDIALMLAQEAGMTMAELQEQWQRQDQE